MIFNEDLMNEFDGDTSSLGGWFIVHVPEFCESEFEIAEVINGDFISQGNRDQLNNYVKSYMPIEQYL